MKHVKISYNELNKIRNDELYRRLDEEAIKRRLHEEADEYSKGNRYQSSSG